VPTKPPLAVAVVSVLAVAVSICGGAHWARAQYVPYGPFEVYPSQVYREGPGFKLWHDGLVLHPGILAELGYDSNVLMASKSGQAGVLRLLAHVDLSTLSPQRLGGARPRIEFRVGAGLEYRQFFSTDPRVGSAQQVNAQSTANLTLWPGDPFTLRVYNHFLVTNDARNLEVANWQSFAPRVYDRLGLLATYRPRNGPLEIGLGESFRVDHYVQDTLQKSRALSNDINLYAQLRVLPETLVKLELRSSYVGFYGQGSPVPPSAPLRIIAGAQTMLLPFLGASMYLGYGNSLHYGLPETSMPGTGGSGQLVGDVSRARYSNFVGGFEARLRMWKRIQLSAGWARDFFDSIYATYFRDDRLYVHYQHAIWRSLSLRGLLDVYLRDYGTLVTASAFGYDGYLHNQTRRSDVLTSFQVEAVFRPLSWIEVGASYTVLDDTTDFGFDYQAILSTDPTTGRIDYELQHISAAFVKHVLLFKVDLAY
jgi:hypothetical protein